MCRVSLLRNEGTGFPDPAKQATGSHRTGCLYSYCRRGYHPVPSCLGLRIKEASENSAKLLVISPNETELCRYAEKWLKPYPGTELALIMGMCYLLVEEELFDEVFTRMYCSNFDEFREALDDFPLGRVERITGVPRDLIEEAARIYAAQQAGRNLLGFSRGSTQYAHGTDNVHALTNLAILTANHQTSPRPQPPLGTQQYPGGLRYGMPP